MRTVITRIGSWKAVTWFRIAAVTGTAIFVAGMILAQHALP